MNAWTLAHWTARDAEALSGQLPALAEERYRLFQGRLLNTSLPFYGVRLSLIKMLARQICNGNWREYLAVSSPVSYEETMLRGFVIGNAQGDLSEILGYTASFIPLIDSWGICDSFVSALKLADSHRKEFWGFLAPYLTSKDEFAIRFGVVMLLYHFLTEEYIDRVLNACVEIRHEGYYAKMAVAWMVSMCYVQFPEKALTLLRSGQLDSFTHNKAIQKMLESRQVPERDKTLLRGLKRGERSLSSLHP